MTPPPSSGTSSAANWRERLKAAVKASGRKQSAIAVEAGIAPETLSRILNAAHVRPELETVAAIAHAVNENVGWLLGERGFTLSTEQQARLSAVVDFLQGALLAAPPPKRAASGVPNSVAAFRGTRRRTSEIEIPAMYSSIGATIVYRAIGDSMIDAGITDGDLLFVKQQSDLRVAHRHIVVCRLAGRGYAKQLDISAGHIRLLSRNSHYDAIEIDEDADDFRLVGIVVGRSGRPTV